MLSALPWRLTHTSLSIWGTQCPGVGQCPLKRRTLLMVSSPPWSQVYLWVGLPTTGYLLRPLNDDRIGFKPEPLCTSTLNRQLQHHLRRLGLFQGESTHGLRRGTAIHDHQHQGRSPAEVGLRLQHVNPGGPQTLQYLDTSRETGGPPRQRRRLT